MKTALYPPKYITFASLTIYTAPNASTNTTTLTTTTSTTFAPPSVSPTIYTTSGILTSPTAPTATHITYIHAL